MKIYILLLALLSLYIFSCQNPKEEIVNQQIQIKKDIDSLNNPDGEIDFLAREISKKKIDSIYGKPYDTSEMMEERKQLELAIDSKFEYRIKKEKLLKKYDSLEMELKKY